MKKFSFPNEATSLEFAKALDQEDPLASYRSLFLLPKRKDGTPKIYFNGNSLGLQPRSARTFVERIMKEWETLAVKGHFEGDHPWIPYHERLAKPMAEIVGALKHEVVIMNTLTVNLHLMMISFYQPTARRYKILMESDAFPSDRYAVESQLRFHGYDPEESIIYLSPEKGNHLLSEEAIEKILREKGEEIALVLLGVPNYYTGQVLNMKRITTFAHQKGCKVGFNLAHGAGNIPLSLHDDGADFAVWCTYKYLNAGPGNLSGCFIHERYADDHSLNRFAGWWGQKHETRFDMRQAFDPMYGADGWCISNAPILPLGALEATLEIFQEAGMLQLREKSEHLTAYLEFLLRSLNREEIKIITPGEPNQRGCQLSVLIENSGTDLYDNLTAAGVITDWRKPDVIRAAPTPLYNTFEEVYEFTRLLEASASGIK